MRIYKVLIACLFFSAPVLAQQAKTPIPADLLAADHQRCMQGCVSGFGDQVCKALCDCTVSQFKVKFDFSSYLDLSAQMTKGEISPENRTVLDTIANYCTMQIEKSGIELPDAGEEAPADAP